MRNHSFFLAWHLQCNLSLFTGIVIANFTGHFIFLTAQCTGISYQSHPFWIPLQHGEIGSMGCTDAFLSHGPQAEEHVCVWMCVCWCQVHVCDSDNKWRLIDFHRFWCLLAGGLGSAGWCTRGQSKKWVPSSIGKPLGSLYPFCLNLSLGRTPSESAWEDRKSDQQISWMLGIPEFVCRRGLEVTIFRKES